MARRRLSNFVDAYLRHYLQMKQQEEQYNLQRRNQSALAGEQADLQMLEKVLGDPSKRIAGALQRGGVRTVGRVPIEALVQQRNEGLGNVSSAIQGAKTRPELPTQIGVERLVGMQPSLDSRNPLDVEAGISELNQRDQRLKMLTPPMRVDKAYNSLTGAEETKFLPGAPEDLTGQSVITSPDPRQRGLDKGAEELARLTSPGLTEAQIGEGNQLEAGLRGGKAATAAATAGAGERARLEVQFDPKYVALELDKIRQKATIEAAATANQMAAKAAFESQNNAFPAITLLDQIKQSYDRVKLGPDDSMRQTRSIGRSIGGATGTLQFVNPEAASHDKLANAYLMQIYRAHGGTGANVSDRDLQFAKDGVPYSSTISEVGDVIWQKSKEQLLYAPLIVGRYTTADVTKRLEINKTWRDLAERARQAGATQFEDPFTPGQFVPVVR